MTEDVARGLEETLAAALTDPAVAEQLRTGRLTSGPTPTGSPAASTGAGRARPPRPPSSAVRSRKQSNAAGASPRAPSAAERRRQQAMVRLQRDLREAEKRAGQAEQAQAVTAEAFEESQRALAEAEMAVADLRAELERTEQPATRSSATANAPRPRMRKPPPKCNAPGSGSRTCWPASRRCKRPASVPRQPAPRGLHRPHEPSADDPAVGPRPEAGRRDPGRRTGPTIMRRFSQSVRGASTVRHLSAGGSGGTARRAGATVRSRS